MPSAQNMNANSSRLWRNLLCELIRQSTELRQRSLRKLTRLRSLLELITGIVHNGYGHFAVVF
ncbi:hypothetical protein C8K11_104162 [Novosphingobium sp. GV055]|nr:hypothetical protein C8K11_104162 [Novosphingobium sp. GV055]PUB04843.1 hypothetical protein C8K12_104162 [Novosphingobium sp. GV061]PUB21162.1 hypothetical protein C8K14_104162 [Novosphingobium sp. GV079]PUB42888.1 hypothetical protein C8K10_104162 [Novosphingobium sp. GV027]